MNIEIFKKQITNILFPRDFTCDICGVETFEGNLCPSCKRDLIFNDGAVCPLCGRKFFSGEICLDCKEEPPAFKGAVSAIVYEGGGAFLIKKFKNGNGYLKEYFADLLAKKLEAFPPADGIVFVPMTKRALKRRGYNQAELIAKALSVRTGIPVIRGALEKVRDTDEQKSLSKSERAENLKSCFKAAKKQVSGKTLLLVDDVMTTGSTAKAVCTALLKAGAKEVYLATVASVEHKINKVKSVSETL